MESKKYNWIATGLSKHIPADVAVQELERIETVFGLLTPENILMASEPEDAIFHKLFTWDDKKAAFQFRLQQARTIINNIEVTVISDGKERSIPVFEIVKTEAGRVYKNVSDMSTDELTQVRSNAVSALNYWKNKLSIYKEFKKSASKIEEAIIDLDNLAPND